MRTDPTVKKNEEFPLALTFAQIKFDGLGYVSSPSPFAGPSFPTNVVMPSELGGIERRQWANFTDTDGTVSRVIVEFKALPHSDNAESAGIEAVKRDLNVLVQTLRIAELKRDAFRVLYCHGWYETLDHFGLVYRLPPSEGQPHVCQSLTNILLCKEQRFLLARELENRLELVKTLAWTMLELHSVNWVHRSFTPNNILLFSHQIGRDVRIDWRSPYVVGFDLSRSDTGVSEEKTHGEMELAIRIYTHPQRQSREYMRYQKSHDIYSLGVILLEIGRLESFMDSAWAGKLDKLSPDQLKEMFVRKARAPSSVLGTRFCNAVLTCLTGDFHGSIPDDDDYLFLSNFRDEVCEQLSEIEL